LTILVAFAAYLRQVSLYADELRFKILHGDIWFLPPTALYSQKRWLKQTRRLRSYVRSRHL
jgi:hypothetical protein